MRRVELEPWLNLLTLVLVKRLEMEGRGKGVAVREEGGFAAGGIAE